MSRPDLAGSDVGPDSPYPLCLSGKVIAGFGRGGKKVERPFSLDTNPWGLVCLSILRLPVLLILLITVPKSTPPQKKNNSGSLTNFFVSLNRVLSPAQLPHC